MDRYDLAVRAQFADVQRQRSDMHAYQDGFDGCVEFLRDNPFSALFIDMGMGKSVSALTVIADLVASFAPEVDNPVLIIGPLRVVVDTWPTEITAWQHTAWLSHTLIRVADDDPRILQARKLDRGSDEAWERNLLKTAGKTDKEIRDTVGHTRETQVRHQIMGELARTRTAVHMINREQVEWLVYFWKGAWPYRTVIIDESSSFKDHNSKRFKALAKNRNTPGLIERLHCLTATPAAETYEHLFPQIYLLDRGKRLGKNITAYRDEHFTYNKYSQRYVLRKGHEEKILSKIRDICLVMKAKDYLKRDDPTVIPRFVTLDQVHLERIKQLERDFVVDLPDGTVVEAKTAAILASMLLQMASGTVYETLMLQDWDTDDFKKIKRVHNLHDHKIEALREIYEEAQTQGEPLLVAYHFKSSLAKLRKAFPKAEVIDDAGKYKKRWNDGKIPMLLIHPQSAGHGLNLQYGSHILVFYDIIYSLEQYLQTIGRLDRQGQRWKVLVYMLIAQGTRDVDAYEDLIQKRDAQETMFKILKRLVREFREKRAAVDF